MTDVFPRFIQSDCMEAMRSMPDLSVDAIITDPPYNAINRSAVLRTYDKGEADSAPIDIPALADEFTRIARGSVYVWCSDEQYTPWVLALKARSWSTRICVWTKTNPAPVNGQLMWLSAIELCVFGRKSKAIFNEFCAAPVWHGPSETAKIDWHPTPKPEWLMRRLVRASTNPGDVVFDPFMGSGTTGVACGLEGRRFIGCDMNAEYVRRAAVRVRESYAQLGMSL